MTSEATPPSLNFLTTPEGGHLTLDEVNVFQTHLQASSFVESGLAFATHQSQSRNCPKTTAALKTMQIIKRNEFHLCWSNRNAKHIQTKDLAPLLKQGLRRKESGQITQNGNQNRMELSNKNVRQLQNDGIVDDCPGQQDVDKISKRIGNNPSLQKKIKPIPIKQNFPKCTVYCLEPEFTKEQMEAALLQSFGDVHKDLKVLFPIKRRPSKTHWVFQTPTHLAGSSGEDKILPLTGNPYSQRILE
ncbi:hypothetical protein AVEN_248-1 [Araneus ventricosus]|uniref:Uncharacterized protein n=1 Tax=Araneus ventricosus TaxID=182803 RepID=A0A4Y2KKF7_ARAVE|nr:hypothetical protein AVEN_248-1 [Araneus ventricosus]